MLAKCIFADLKRKLLRNINSLSAPTSFPQQWLSLPLHLLSKFAATFILKSLLLQQETVAQQSASLWRYILQSATIKEMTFSPVIAEHIIVREKSRTGQRCHLCQQSTCLFNFSLSENLGNMRRNSDGFELSEGTAPSCWEMLIKWCSFSLVF